MFFAATTGEMEFLMSGSYLEEAHRVAMFIN
jgi:hypothetical protein